MFGLTLSQKISLVGIGMGAEKTLTLEGKKQLNEAELLIGAKRMTEAVQKPGQMVLHEYRSEKIVSTQGTSEVPYGGDRPFRRCGILQWCEEADRSAGWQC